MSYKLYIVNDNDRSVTWSHTEGFGGKPCLVFPDDKDCTIVIEHPTCTTYIDISAEGFLEIESEQSE
jgi:hypothetical protein